jgi:hypothetical protein
MIKSRRMRWAGHVARMEAKTNAYRILVGKPDGKRPLGRPRRRWVDSIKMDIREIGWGGLAQDTDQWSDLMNKVINLRVPENVGWSLSSCTTGGFSGLSSLKKSVSSDVLVNMFFHNTGKLASDYKTSHTARKPSSQPRL